MRNSAVAAFRRPAAVATRTASSWSSPPALGRQPGRGRLLDELLVPPLERAVALAERDHAPGVVAEQLDLDVPRRRDLALQVDRPVAERGRRLARAGDQRRRQLGRLRDPAHARARRRRRLP